MSLRHNLLAFRAYDLTSETGARSSHRMIAIGCRWVWRQLWYCHRRSQSFPSHRPLRYHVSPVAASHNCFPGCLLGAERGEWRHCHHGGQCVRHPSNHCRIRFRHSFIPHTGIPNAQPHSGDDGSPTGHSAIVGASVVVRCCLTTCLSNARLMMPVASGS